MVLNSCAWLYLPVCRRKMKLYPEETTVFIRNGNTHFRFWFNLGRLSKKESDFFNCRLLTVFVRMLQVADDLL